MDVPKELVRGCLLYDFKVGLSAAALSLRICQVFGDSAVNERKTYRLSKWVPHMLLEVRKQQRVAACLSLLSRHHSASIFNRMLTSDKKWVLYDTPKRSKH
ncbi:histone-lysine N-methyltransferase SETMAR [Trichonephila inaurata madagascariensis]|uniref:Histone-lysine N-methyltransferase SETMAR n=1 Tax=Trichonephila inaurata madagascariensis TaxID=2747483 RepID=A0A8X6IU11_9ARAC|nr:histone-lysine N-methyltransferase SETMAR [Trichonephila inaurata madagascariensis]